MKQVVIIGGGFAGALSAKELEKYFNVTIIDTKPYFEFTPSILRTIVNPSHLNKIQSLHSNYLTSVNIIVDDVISITGTTVNTKSNTFKFDYLIISSGSKYHTPIKEEGLVIATRITELKSYAKKLKNSNNILIIGGGIVGVELAAEIICKYPHKNLTLVHSKERLIEKNCQKVSCYVLNFLQELGVNFILNKRVTYAKKVYLLDKKKLPTDLAFLCTGIKPSYHHLSYLSKSLTSHHYLKVNNHLQVDGFNNIFAAGDITDLSKEKTAQNAEKQAEVVVKNILNLSRGRSLISFEAKERPFVISLGGTHGIISYKGLMITGLIPALLKRFIEWKTMRRYR